MNSIKRIFIAMQLCMGLYCYTFAATDADTSAVPWSYSQCVEYAREHNINIQKTLLTKQAGLYDLEAAKAQMFPTLDFATTQSYVNRPRPATGVNGNSYDGSYGLNLGWTIYDGSKRKNTIKVNEVQTQIDNLAVESIQDDIETEILTNYIQIMYAKESITIAEQALEVSTMQKDRAEQLMKSGRLSRVDYSQLESQYYNDVYNVVSAKSNLANKKMALKKLLELGIDYDFNILNVKVDESQLLKPLASKSEIYAIAASWVPELKSSKLQSELSDYELKIAKSGSLPKVTLNGGVGTSNGTGTGYGFGDQLLNGLQEKIGVTLSVPILDNKTNKTAVAKANIDKLNAALEYRNAENNLAQTIESIHIEAQSAQAKYQSGKEKLKSAELTDELTNEQFKLGLVNTLDLLTSHNDLLSAQQELLQSKYMALLSIKLLDYYEHKGITIQ